MMTVSVRILRIGLLITELSVINFSLASDSFSGCLGLRRCADRRMNERNGTDINSLARHSPRSGPTWWIKFGAHDQIADDQMIWPETMVSDITAASFDLMVKAKAWTFFSLKGKLKGTVL